MRKVTLRSAAALRELSRGWTGVSTLVVGVCVAAHVLYLAFRWGGDEYVAIVSDGLMIPTSCAVVLLLWKASRGASLDARSRRGWRFYALSYLFFAVGNVLWFCFEMTSETPHSRRRRTRSS